MPATPSRFARVTLALLFLWIGALVPVHARADEAPSDDDDSAQEDEGTAEEGEGTDHTDHDHDAPHVRESITVTAQRPSDTDTHARVEIEAAALERTRGQDLAEAIGQVDGVTVARGAADSSKPIIRGQTERRLLVLSNGVRHASQKWGADHATEIDPFAAGRLSVVKGAAGVKYGPDAIGGVILVDPPRLLTTPGVDGVVQFIGVSNGLRFTGAGRLDLAPAKLPGFVARIEGNYSRGSSLRAPTYVLGNTASQVWNVGATLHYHRGPVHLTATYEHYDLRAGVFYGMSSSTPDAFAASLERDAPLGSEAWTVTPVIDRPMQTVQHDRAVARAEFFGPRGTVHVTYAFQLNRRKEFEPVRSSVEGAQYDFALQTHSLDVAAEHKSLSVGAATLAGGAGASASTQDNVYTGVPLIPNHRSFDVGVFGYERVQTQAIALEVGARYDHQGRRSFLSESAYARHEGRGTLSEDDCDLTESVARCGLAFDVGSVSVGALVHAVPDVLDVKLDLSSASRFPNGDELYMNGSAPTFPVYAAGDPSLGPETTWSLSPTVGLSLGWFEGELSGFFSYINDYIAFTPDLGPDGSPTFDVTIRGAYPRFSYRAVHSLFYGIDGGFTLGPQWPVSLRLGGSLVRGEELATGTPLPFVPADRIHGSVRWTPPHVGVLHEAFIELSGEYVFEQRHIDEAADLAPAPDAYFLLGAGAGARFHVRGENTLEVGIEGGNLLNARYRDYTSLRRYYADEPGLEVRLRLRFEFHQHPMQRSLDDSDPTPDPDHHPDDPPGGV